MSDGEFPIWSGADLQRYADSVVRVELARRHDPALGPNAVEIVTDLLSVLHMYNVCPDDLPPELNLGRMVLDALEAAWIRIDGPLDTPNGKPVSPNGSVAVDDRSPETDGNRSSQRQW